MQMLVMGCLTHFALILHFCPPPEKVKKSRVFLTFSESMEEKQRERGFYFLLSEAMLNTTKQR